MDDLLIGALLTGVLGAGFLAWGVFFYRKLRRLRHYGETVTGSVSGKPDQHVPKYNVSFVTKTGIPERTVAMPKHVKGSRIEVVYDPEKPGRNLPLLAVQSKASTVIAWFLVLWGILLLSMAVSLATRT